MKVHQLKTWADYWHAVYTGEKTFEVRKDDRGFAVDDVLVLDEWDPIEQNYSSNRVYRAVSYVLPGGQFGIEPGYVVMGLRNVTHDEAISVQRLVRTGEVRGV